MATAARTITRVLPRTSTSTQSQLAKQFFQNTRRQYSSSAASSSASSSKYYYAFGTGLVAFGAGYTFSHYQPNLTNVNTTTIKSQVSAPNFNLTKSSSGETPGLISPTATDYQNVYNAIARRLWTEDKYDDGSYGPVILRLAWHASGTYDAASGTGGSNGATMRFPAESSHGANAGLLNARDFLEPIKEQFPWISYSDLWTLAGVCAIQEMQGPHIPWRPGRRDKDADSCTPDGRLPDASQEQNHIRRIFGRMGFDDREMVALSGAHALGRCHSDRSGFDGPWTFSPTVLTNDYYKLLMEEKWGWKPWEGPKQYEDVKTKTLMMLPTDMALVNDDEFRPWVKAYADDGQLFFEDFKKVIVRLFELGVPFEKTGNESEENRMVLKTFDEQGLEA